jgi:hypothetical protein
VIHDRSNLREKTFISITVSEDSIHHDAKGMADKKQSGTATRRGEGAKKAGYLYLGSKLLGG